MEDEKLGDLDILQSSIAKIESIAGNFGKDKSVWEMYVSVMTQSLTTKGELLG
jgi:hypothetical protein